MYLIKRLFFLIPTFFAITVMTFFVTQLAPGDPVSAMTDLNPNVSMQAKEAWAKIRGLDQPVWKRYGHWLSNLLRGDLGYSFKDGEKVADKILSRIPITLTISGISLFLILVLAIPIGVLSAAKKNSWVDHLFSVFVFLGFSIPSFWLALLLVSFLGVRYPLFPVSGIHSLDYEYMTTFEKVVDMARHLFLPLLVSTLTGLAGITRFVRNSMVEVLNEDFILLARANGLSEIKILFEYALKNALLPLITILGLYVPQLLGGAVIFETIFSIPGMGKLMFDAVMARDIPVYMAILTMSAFLTLIGNFWADVAYKMVDPRIKYE